MQTIDSNIMSFKDSCIQLIFLHLLPLLLLQLFVINNDESYLSLDDSANKGQLRGNLGATKE